MKVLYEEQRTQEAEFAFPYHYIPTWQNGGFAQTKYWHWGFRYLGGIQVVLDQLATLSFDSLLDIGCGDGRFIREVAIRYPDRTLLGVDYSERAVGLAKALNPGLDYQVTDVTTELCPKNFDIVTLIEVLEHVPPEHVSAFITGVAGALNAQGRLILTVPHTNKSVNAKHFQHFNSDLLYKILTPYFADIAFIPFDSRSKVITILLHLIGGQGNHYVLTNASVLKWFYKMYCKRYLCTDEGNCLRIAVLCRLR